jgi:L-alanine-DL-glutamate epimerase-like enolase superfamily enzyme
MRIEKIRIYNLQIPFCRVVKHGLFSRSRTENIIIVLQDRLGNKGFGEGTPRHYVTGENLDGCLKSAETLSYEILGQQFVSFDDVTAKLALIGKSVDAQKTPAAFCAMETAVLDMWSRFKKVPVWQLFSSDKLSDALFYSGVIPHFGHHYELLQFIEQIKKLEFRAVKVKIIDPEDGLSQLKLIRKKLGSAIDIRIDANATFSVEDSIRFIKRAKAIRLSAVEQPVQKNDLKGLKKVSQNSDVPIIADESMYTSEGPVYLIENDVCHGLNIRLSSCGGFQKALEIFQRAKAKNMTVVIGAHVGEAAILSYAGRNFAAICPESRYLEGSFSRYVLTEDLVPENIAFGREGYVSTPTRSGLGIEIDETSIVDRSNLHASIDN